MPDVSVVILNLNGRQLLLLCVEHVVAQQGVEIEVVVVDSGSTDGSVEAVRQRFPNVRVVALGRNLGVAAGYNAGFRVARGRYLVALNNDTVPRAGWLRALVDAAETDPHIGAVASLLCRADAPEVIDSAGIAVDVTGSAWDRLGGHPRREAGDRLVEVFGASAGAALYRREMIDDVGLFAEQFFAYLEDADLAWRARLRGWRAVCAPRAVVLHAHSATAREGSPFKLWHLGRNRVWLLARDYPAPQCWLYLPFVAAYDVLASLFAALVRREPHVVRGRLRGLRTLPRVLADRRDIQGRRSAPWRELRATFAPLEGPLATVRRYAYLARRRPPGKCTFRR